MITYCVCFDIQYENDRLSNQIYFCNFEMAEAGNTYQL